MTALAAILLTLSLLLLLWSYLAYPAILASLASRASRSAAAPSGSAPSSVEVLVSAANEEAVIAARVANLISQEFDGRYRVTVGCDGSRDATAQRAREAGDGRLRVVEFAVRRGKAAVLNDLIKASDAEVVVFTDANTRFEPGAVARLAEAFRAERVGAACGRLILEGSEAESAFWDRETRMKENEGRLGLCLGANGAIYAARRSEVRPLPPDTTSMDDFLIPAQVACRGWRVVFVGDAVAREQAPRHPRAEMRRRFRIGVGAGQVLRRERWLWNFARYPLLSFAFLSRKAARWLCPVIALAACLAACASRSLRPAALVLLGTLLLLALGARAGLRPRGAAGRLYYFAVMNLSLAAGILAGLTGYRRPAWEPTVPAG